MSACCCPQWFCSYFILVNKALCSSGNSILSWFLYCVGFSDIGVIATLVFSSLGVWGLTKHSAGSYEAGGSITAVTILRCLTCASLLARESIPFLPCVLTTGVGLGCVAWPEQQVWFDGPDLGWDVGTECSLASSPRQHDFHPLSYFLSLFFPAGVLPFLLSLLLLFILVPVLLHLYLDLAFLRPLPRYCGATGPDTEMLLASTLQKIPSTLLQFSVEFIWFWCNFHIPVTCSFIFAVCTSCQLLTCGIFPCHTQQISMSLQPVFKTKSPSASPFTRWKGFSGQEQVFWSFKMSSKGFFLAQQPREVK